jgi:hypothetical protein
MKKRTIAYFKKNRAFKVLSHASVVDLFTLLSATFELSRSRIVKNDIQRALQGLNAA